MSTLLTALLASACAAPATGIDSTQTPDQTGDKSAVPAEPPRIPGSTAMSQSAEPTTPKAAVYASTEPFVEPTLSAACGWEKPEMYFPSESATVGLMGAVKVEVLASCLTSAPLGDEPVVIMGHASSPGSTEYNRRLGLERAEAVKAALVDAGVEASRVTTYSRGEYLADDDEALRDDRRVVVKLDR